MQADRFKALVYNVSRLSTVHISCLTNLVSSTDVDERTLSDSWIHSISDLELWYSSCQRRDKPVMNAFLDEQSVSTDACLQHTSTCRLHLTCQSNWTDARLQHTSTCRLHLTCQSNCTDRRTSTAHEHLQTALVIITLCSIDSHSQSTSMSVIPLYYYLLCLTLSNPVPWQNWMVAYLGYTLRMTLFRGWPIIVNDTHTRRRL